MDLGWIATGVVGVAGAATTVFVQRSTTAAQRRSEDVRRADEHARERRALERDAVMRLVETYQSAYRYARDFTHDFIMVRMPIPEWPASDEPTEVSKLEEAFGEWWRTNAGDLGVDVLLIADAEVRAATSTCRNVLEEAVEMSGPGWGTVRANVMEAAQLGVEVLGAWLREEPLTDDLRARAASFDKKLELFWDVVTPIRKVSGS